MKLSDLIHNVWKDERVKELGLRKGEVKIVILTTVDHIVKGLLKHGTIKIRGLFTLDIRKVKARRIMNPQTKEIMMTREYHKVGLKVSKKLDDELKNL